MNKKATLNLTVLVVFLFLIQHALADDLVMLSIMDTSRNMEMHRMPLPANWKLNTPQTAEDPNMIGPGGIKVYYRTGGNFSYSDDPYMQQLYQQSGQQMRVPINAAQIVEQDLVPLLTSHGMKFIKQYPLPEIAQRSKTYSSKLYKSMPSQEHFDASGSDWKNENGNMVFVIVDETVSYGQGSVYWYYQLKMLEAPAERFESAKNAFIYGIVNTQDNPQQIQAFNASEQQRSNQSWSQHNARMKQNQQNFDRQQQIHRDTSNAVNDSIMSTYRNQDAASDRAQQQRINTIYDESTVVNPNDGQQYQVESGADQYWINNDGEYIQSDDAFYDPNMDPEQNNQEWQEVEPQY